MIHRDISDKRFQIDSLDGLRGFAALIVVLSHTSNIGMFYVPYLDMRGTGKSGVYLFFLLSSFLLTLPLLNKGSRLLSFSVMSHYWQRRFFRIYPLFTCYLLLAVLSTWVFSHFFGISNFGLPFDLNWQGFLAHMALQEGKEVTWSIAVEFKFYFVLPIIVFAIVKIRSFGVWFTTVFVLLLITAAQIYSLNADGIGKDLRLTVHLPVFLIGIMLAFFQNELNQSDKSLVIVTNTYRILGYLGLIGVLIMTPSIFSVLFFEVPNNYFSQQNMLLSICWALVLLSAVNVDGLIQRFFCLSVLRFLGTLSFSLYLFHPIFIEVIRRLDLNGFLSAWLILIGSVLSAFVSFTLLEKPVSKFKF